MGNMQYLTAIVVVYLFVVGYLGYVAYRRTKTAADYLLAGRESHPFVMAISYGATFISTSAIVGFGGAAAMFGMGLLWLTFLNIAVGIFVAFIFLGKPTRRMGHRLDAHTFPELLGRRYDSKFLQVFSGLVIILFMPLYAGVVMMGAARFIEVRIGVSYEAALFFFSTVVVVYVIMGGLKGVLYTDTFQGLVMFVGMAIVIFLTYAGLGGITAAHQALTDLTPQALAVPRLAGGGHQGWTAMPTFGSPLWWALVSTIVMNVGIGVLAQPQLVVRFMTVKSSRELNRAVLSGGVFILMMTGVAFVVGALSNVYFFRDPSVGRISIAAVEAGNIEQIIPLFITKYMPWWLPDIFLVTLLAAAMSTLSSQFHAMGTAVCRDLIGTSGARTILVTRMGILFTFLVSVSLAYSLVKFYGDVGVAIVARGTAIFFGLCAATFLPIYVGGLYTRAVTRAGAVAGAVTGFLVSAFWLVFMHQKESEALRICNWLFSVPSLVSGKRLGFIFWQEVDPTLVALPLAIVVMIGVSMVTRRLSKEHLDHCFAAPAAV